MTLYHQIAAAIYILILLVWTWYCLAPTVRGFIEFRDLLHQGYSLRVYAYLLGQYRIQLIAQPADDIVQELCTYDPATLARRVTDLRQASDPLLVARSWARPWNCESVGGRIRLDSAAPEGIRSMIDPERLEIARATAGQSFGRAGIPRRIVAIMYEVYLEAGSVRAAAPLLGRTQQALWSILKRHGLTNPKKRKPALVHRGERFAQDHQGFYRSTSYASRQKGGHRLLHRVVWEETHGPIPTGHMIVFRNGDRADCSLQNLRCVSRSAHRREQTTFQGNAWTIYHQRREQLSDTWYQALEQNLPATEIEARRLAVEALTPPQSDPALRQRRREYMRAKWASYTPEQRAARIAASRAGRRITREELSKRVSAGRRRHATLRRIAQMEKEAP